MANGKKESVTSLCDSLKDLAEEIAEHERQAAVQRLTRDGLIRELRRRGLSLHEIGLAAGMTGEGVRWVLAHQ